MSRYDDRLIDFISKYTMDRFALDENPNSFRTNGLLTIKNYTLFAKNPTIAKFFREIGYADELGSFKLYFKVIANKP